LSDDATAVTDDTTTEDAPAAEAAADESPVATASTDEEVTETAEETPVAEETAAAESAEAEETPDAEPAEAEAAAPVADALPGVRVARVFVCERGHRTTTLWAQPEVCQARPVRTAPVCGLTLYHITELPEQVQKALNPLKASKKASKKK